MFTLKILLTDLVSIWMKIILHPGKECSDLSSLLKMIVWLKAKETRNSRTRTRNF